eukprot:2466282-Pyramimonas_sp.AAC.1
MPADVPLNQQVNRAFQDLRTWRDRTVKACTYYDRLEAELKAQRDKVRECSEGLALAEKKHQELVARLNDS